MLFSDRTNPLLRFFLAIVLLLFLSPAGAEVLHGRVVGIMDGDTLDLRTESETVRIRLAQIDTPERGQPFGNVARKALSDLVFGADVRVEASGKDRYGRVIGTVYRGQMNVNAELVRTGMAWVYRRYLETPFLLALEREARDARRGLWRDADPVPPWEWRRRDRG